MTNYNERIAYLLQDFIQHGTPYMKASEHDSRFRGEFSNHQDHRTKGRMWHPHIKDYCMSGQGATDEQILMFKQNNGRGHNWYVLASQVEAFRASRIFREKNMVLVWGEA